MKVKLSLGNSDFVGYKNVNPFTELKEIHDNSVMELYCDQEVLTKVSNVECKTFIKSLISKIRKGGSIVITAPDISFIAVAFLNRKIQEEDLSQLLDESKGFYNCRYIEDILRELNIKIESMSISNYYFHVKGTRE